MMPVNALFRVLTDEQHFQGKLEHLGEIKKVVDLPLLRKDFIIDEYQVYESAAFNADAVLLITAILTPEKLEKLIKLCQTLGMDCLVEVHDEREIDMALRSGASIIGINNRDLRTFNVDIGTTQRLRSLIPPDKIVVSESGVSSRQDIDNLKALGVNAALVGEALLTSADIAYKMRELLA